MTYRKTEKLRQAMINSLPEPLVRLQAQETRLIWEGLLEEDNQVAVPWLEGDNQVAVPWLEEDNQVVGGLVV